MEKRIIYKSLFILARSAPMAPATLEGIKSRLADKGFDISRIIYDQYCRKPFEGQVFDFICIDGRARNLCLKLAVQNLRPGGILVLDNSDRPQYDTSCVPSSWKRHDFSNGLWSTSAWLA